MDEFPILLMGRDTIEFKRRYKGPIQSIQTLEEVRELVSYYHKVSNLDRILVIEDLSLLNRQAEGILLKFVEESPIRLIFLSRYDKVSSVFLSRMKTIRKTPINKTSSRFLSISKGYKELQEREDDNSEYTRYLNIMELCPEIALYNKRIKRSRVKDKLLQLID